MKKGFLVLFFAFIGSFSAFGQELQPHTCGNAQDQSDFLPRLRENKIVMEAMRVLYSRLKVAPASQLKNLFSKIANSHVVPMHIRSPLSIKAISGLWMLSLG